MVSERSPATEAEVWAALEAVKDPEIPVVSVVELGVVREVTVEGDRARVSMTPTFSGCPALHVMQAEIEARLRDLGFREVEVEIALSPAWTTDWIRPEAREKMRAFGIAPAPQHAGDVNVMLSLDPVPCPSCGSEDTELKNPFGPNPCKELHYCHGCEQPFYRFKPL